MIVLGKEMRGKYESRAKETLSGRTAANVSSALRVIVMALSLYDLAGADPDRDEKLVDFRHSIEPLGATFRNQSFLGG